MRTGLRLVLAAALTCPLMHYSVKADDQPAFKDDREKASYAMGMLFATQLKGAQLSTVDLEVMVSAMKEVLAGNSLKLTPPEAQQAVATYRQQRVRELADFNMKEGQRFLISNKTRPGIKTREVIMPDGKTNEFQYRILKQGDGEGPQSTDLVEVNYSGRLINGDEFDNSAKRPGGRPVTMPVGGVIRGFSEALQMMPVGSKWELYIPGSLGYGDQPRQNIPPGSMLIFEVELVSAEAPKVQAPPTQPLTSDIVKVPSQEDMKRGSNIQVLKPEDVEKAAAAARNQSRTNGH